MSANKNSAEDGYKIVTGCLLFLLALPFLTVYSYFANGFILSKLWSWFIVTTFGLEPLTIVQAIGVSMVVGFLTSHRASTNNKDKTTSDTIAEVLIALLSPWFTLLIGWIIYSTWFIK